MHPFKKLRRLLLGGLAGSLVGLGGFDAFAQQPAQPAATAKQPGVRIGKAGELLVPLGGVARFVPKPAGFSNVLTENPDILVAIQDPDDVNAILLSGRTPGVTRLTISYPNGRSNTYEVIVQADYDLLRRVIQRTVPTANVDVVAGVGNTVILTGYVNKVEDADVILRIAQGAAGTGAANVINAIQVGGVHHVQIEVVVAQVNRTELRSRGFDFVVNGTTVQFGSFISGLIGTPTVSPANSQANIQFGITPASVFGALRALRSEGLAKFLSEPKVVTQSGRPAFIRSGGQQAVLSQTAGGLGSISVALEQVGTNLEVLPIVLGNGKIYLQVSPSVRQVNNGFGIQTSAGFSPGFTEQATQASVMLESGQTFAIGGLLETTVQASSNRVPVLGDLPYIGTAFSVVNHDERETELVVLVTPRLVEPLDCTQVPKRVPGRETRSPDDYELYLEGLLEAPRGQRQVWNGRCYNAAWKCDTNGLFPCKGNVCTGGAGGGATGNCGAGGCGTAATLGGHAYPVPAAAPAALPPVTAVPVPTADAGKPADPAGVAPAEATAPATAGDGK